MTVTIFPLQKRVGYNADSLPNPLYNHTARTLATHEMDKFIVCYSLNGIKERKLNNAYIAFHMTSLYITKVDR